MSRIAVLPRLPESPSAAEEAMRVERYERQRIEVRVELQNKAKGPPDKYVNVAAAYAAWLREQARAEGRKLTKTAAGEMAAKEMDQTHGIHVRADTVRKRL